MVRTNKNSWFALLSLEDIRSAKNIVLQAEDTGTTFSDTGRKCYLCELVSSHLHHYIKDESDLIKEICTLNTEKRKLEKKVARLEKALAERTEK